MTGEGGEGGEGEGGEGEENCHPLITSLLNEGAVIKIDPQGARGWGSEFYFFPRIFIFIR